MKKSSIKTLTVGVSLAAVALALTACGSNPLNNNSNAAPNTAGASGGGQSITIGSADFPESQIVAAIYSQALQHAGVHVTEKFNIGAREVYVKALQDGSIDLVPEYSGALLTYFQPNATQSTPSDVYSALTSAVPAGMKVLTQSEAQDADTLTVTRATANQYNLKTFSDLAKVSNQLIMGAGPSWKTRQAGLVGLQKVYNMSFKDVQTLDNGGSLSVLGLKNGQVQVADIFSTDPSIKTNNFVVLQDDKNLIPAQNVLPLISGGKASAAITSVLNTVSAKLTTSDLIDLNTKAQGGADTTQIAKDWLKQANLLN